MTSKVQIDRKTVETIVEDCANKVDNAVNRLRDFEGGLSIHAYAQLKRAVRQAIHEALQ